ncbi:MAG: PadR family transcriptional regulator [Planctomycetota bacterium]
MQKWKSQLRKGLVELTLLAALRDQGEAYGYQLLQVLADVEGMTFSESTIYPVLARMAQNGLVKSRMVPSESGPKRRYYLLSPKGLTRLDELAAEWQSVSRSINRLLQLDESGDK